MAENMDFSGTVKPLRCMYDTEGYKIYKCEVVSGAGFKKGWGITIAGDMPKLADETIYNVAGFPKETKYGVTYNITSVTPDFKNMDRDTYYRNFLASITSEFLADSILESCPDFVRLILDGKDDKIDLSKIKGVKQARFNTIKEKVIDNIKVMDIIDEYGEYGITFTLALKMIKSCNNNMDLVRERMQRDPYGLITNIGGMGFIKADAFIMKVRPDLRDSEYRLYSCVDYILTENEENGGSTWATLKDIYDQCGELCPEATKHTLKVVENEKLFYWDSVGKRISKRWTYETEKYISQRLIEIRDSDHPLYDWGEEPDFEKYRIMDSRELTDEQMSIMKLVFHNNVNVLCGSAGTGKTSSLKAVLDFLDDMEKSYTLVSPTGAASKVFTRSVSTPKRRRKASTIHKLIMPLESASTEGYESYVVGDVIVVDEMSMCDINIIARLLRLTKEGTKIIFVGDYRQLASVGVGNFSTDIIESGEFKVSTLTKVFRFAEGGLTWVSEKSRVGKAFLPDAMSGKVLMLGDKKDFVVIKSDKNKMLDEVTSLYMQLLKSGKSIMDIGVISALNVRDLGANQINTMIQSLLTQGQPSLKYGNTTFNLNDKVMQIKNSYGKLMDDGGEGDIFNGNKGIIVDVAKEEGLITVDFDGDRFVYSRSDMGELSLAYCTSVHKYQGDSAEIIIFVTPSSHTFMLSRNLLYTGYTRASSVLYNFIDKESTISTALRKSENMLRDTFLCEMLKNQNSLLTNN